MVLSALKPLTSLVTNLLHIWLSLGLGLGLSIELMPRVKPRVRVRSVCRIDVQTFICHVAVIFYMYYDQFCLNTLFL